VFTSTCGLRATPPLLKRHGKLEHGCSRAPSRHRGPCGKRVRKRKTPALSRRGFPGPL